MQWPMLIIDLGRNSVSSRSRVPCPPASKTIGSGLILVNVTDGLYLISRSMLVGHLGCGIRSFENGFLLKIRQ